MRRVLDVFRGLIFGDPRRLARQTQQAEWVAAEPELLRFAADLRLSAGVSGIAFGHVRFRDGTRQAVRLGFDRLAATHVGVSGASGSGKTTLALDLLDQALRLPNVRLLAVDPKGDLEVGLREGRLPLLASQMGPEFAGRLRYLRPFASGTAAPLRLAAREPGVPIEVQSLSLATAMAEASGIELSPPAVHAFTKLARLAIELNEPLTEIVTWITRPELFSRDARRSQDERLRHYALVEFPREHRGMLRSLLARLESVLLLPCVRAALSAPTCISFAQSLDDHHLLIDLSHPPGGQEAAVRILGGPIIGRLTRAVLNRHVTDHSPHVLFAIDELQEVLTHYEASSFGRLAALARSRRLTAITINQQRVQLGTKLSEVLRTNFGIEAIFRCHATDADALSHVLPVPPNATRPSEERRALIRRMVSLPRRSFLLWIKDAAVPAHFVRARKVDAGALRREALMLPESVRDELGQWPMAVEADRNEEDVRVASSSDPQRSAPFQPESEADLDSPFPPLG